MNEYTETIFIGGVESIVIGTPTPKLTDAHAKKGILSPSYADQGILMYKLPSHALQLGIFGRLNHFTLITNGYKTREKIPINEDYDLARKILTSAQKTLQSQDLLEDPNNKWMELMDLKTVYSDIEKLVAQIPTTSANLIKRGEVPQQTLREKAEYRRKKKWIT